MGGGAAWGWGAWGVGQHGGEAAWGVGQHGVEQHGGGAAWGQDCMGVGLHGVGKVQVCVYYAQILYYYCIPGFFHAIAIIPM